MNPAMDTSDFYGFATKELAQDVSIAYNFSELEQAFRDTARVRPR